MNPRDPASPSMSRRSFLGALAGAPLLLEERAPIVDTHMHIWTDNAQKYPFAHPFDPNFRSAPIPGTVETLVGEMDREGIDFAVLVQVIYYGWDNRYVADCLTRHPQRLRAHGLIDPMDPDVAGRLEFWVRHHGFAGMRFSPIYYKGKDEWLTSDAHRRLWRKAGELGSIFNFFISSAQLPRLETMLAAFPDVRVVIDHLARVDLAGPDAEVEVSRLVRLARYRNVWVKISELNLLSPGKKFPYADTFAHVKRVYEAFGPDRLLWGTGFPGNTRVHFDRPRLDEELALVRKEIPFFSASDRRKILGQNAVKLWGFGV